MVKSHEVDLTTSVFNRFTENDYIIIQSIDGLEVNDYILFRQTETVGEETRYSGLYRMAKVEKIITDDGLKEGYVLLVVNKLQ